MAKVGRPTKYDPKYCQEIVDYFDVEPTKIVKERFYYKNGDEKERDIEVANELPTIEKFCIDIGISKSTLHEWRKNNKEFSNAYNVARALQQDLWLKNGLKGLYNASFAIFAGKNMFGWRDKQELEHSGGVKVVNLTEEIQNKHEAKQDTKSDSEGQEQIQSS